MANETTNTELDFIVPELWQPQLLQAVYDADDILNRVQRVDGDVRGKGDILHLPAMPVISTNAVGSSGSVTNQTVTPTEAQLTVDTWRESTMTLVDKADIQSIGDIIAAFQAGAPQALGEKMVSDLLALATDANITTNVVGDGSQPLDEDALAASIGKLMATKFGGMLRDPNRVSWFLDAAEWQNLKKVGVYTHADVSGSSAYAGDKLALPNFYGVPYFLSNQVRVSSSIRYNLLAIREALALGVQRNIEMMELPRADLARRFNVNVLYGVKVRAQARAVLVKSRDV